MEEARLVRLLTDYWPWWVAILWLVGYELVALRSRGRVPTLSHLVWQGHARWRWLALVVGLTFLLLWGHFFLDWWRRAAPGP